MIKAVSFFAIIVTFIQVAWATPTGVTSTQSTQTKAESADQSSARYWSLSLEEYQKYQALMRGIRGSFSDPKITPIEVLGIHATNSSERRKYAELFARLMAEDAGRVLAFQNEYQIAFARLYPSLKAVQLQNAKALQNPNKSLSSVPSIPTTGVKAFSTSSRVTTNPIPVSIPAKLAAGDRLLLFTSSNCQTCNAAIRKALSIASSSLPVDIFFVGSRDDSDVRASAQANGIDPSLVSTGSVTLNLDRGTYSKVLPWSPELPQVVRRRGQTLQQIHLADINQ